MTKQYFGPQTQKAIKNFPFSFRRTPREFIYSIAEIKKASALAHFQARELSRARKQAIVKACDEVLKGKFDNQFILPAFQGGAGTSNHMNVNEVVASRATEILSSSAKATKDLRQKNTVHPIKSGKAGPPPAEFNGVHPNDHVNLSHSTNDVMPSALKITAFILTGKLLATLDNLIKIFENKAQTFARLPKLARTHLQDAVPITLGDEFKTYGEYLRRGKQRVELASKNLLELNLGGSAVGNSINASQTYIKLLYKQLKKITGQPFRPAQNLMSQASSNTDFVALSQSLTALAVDLSKIANDLRLLASGPRGGFAEIILPELQAGSSIMPGKVNPVLPEALNQLYYLVSGNNLTIEHAAAGAQLEMSVMLPVITDRLLESLKLMDEMLNVFGQKCVKGIKPNKKRLKKHLDNSTAYATFLTPRLGYDTAASAVKEALKTGKTLREVILNKKLLTNKEFDALVKLNL